MLAFEVAAPSSTQPTVSTLTTEGGGGGGKEREDGVQEVGKKRVSIYRPSRVCLIVLTSKLRLQMMVRMGGNVGGVVIFSPRHALRALQHVLKNKRGDLAVCKAAILDKFQKRYRALCDSGRGQIDSKKRLSKCIYESVALQQESAVGNLLKKRGVMVSGCQPYPLHPKVLFHLHRQGQALQPLSKEASRICLPSFPREQCQQ